MLRRHVITSISALLVASTSMAARAAVAALPINANVSRVDPSLAEPESIKIDATAERRAQEWLQRVRTGAIDRKLLTPELNDILSDEAIKTGTELVAKLGPPVSLFPYQRRFTAAGMADYYRVKFAASTVTWILSVGSDGLINGFALRRRSRDTIFGATLRTL